LGLIEFDELLCWLLSLWVGYGRWHRQWLRPKEKTATNNTTMKSNERSQSMKGAQQRNSLVEKRMDLLGVNERAASHNS